MCRAKVVLRLNRPVGRRALGGLMFLSPGTQRPLGAGGKLAEQRAQGGGGEQHPARRRPVARVCDHRRDQRRAEKGPSCATCTINPWMPLT